MNQKAANALKLLASIAVIAALFHLAGTEKIIQSLAVFNLFYALPVLLIFLIVLLISAYNVRILYDTHAALNEKDFLHNYLYSWAIGSIFPGKIGDFSLAYMVKDKVRVGESTAIILLDKLVTLLVLTVFGSLSIFLFFRGNDAMNAVLLLAAIWLAGILIVLTSRGRNVLKMLMPKKVLESFAGFSSTMNSFLSEGKMRLCLNLTLTLAKLLLQSTAFVLLFMGLGIQTGIVEIMLITSAATLLSFLPITMGGLGLREGAFAFLALQAGIPLKHSVSASIISTAINYLIVGAIALLYLMHGNKGAAK